MKKSSQNKSDAVKALKHRRRRATRAAKWKNTYYKPSEVVVHNSPDDCWVSLLGIVKNLTPLLNEYRNSDLTKPILAEAGKDISHWFDVNGELLTYVDPVTKVKSAYLPHGLIPHMEYLDLPSAKWKPPPKIPWWKDEKYNVGVLSKNVRPIRLKNLIVPNEEVLLNVCEEETLKQIRKRYLPFNSNANNYTWKYQKQILDMKKTLTENMIPDLRPKFKLIGLPEDFYVPCLMLYYNDNFK